jgi:hypothetical protein
MPTKSKQVVTLNLQRAGYFLDIHENTQDGAGAPNLARRELPRASIVYAVGALDAYLSELSAEVIVHQLLAALATDQIREVLRRVQQELPTLSLEVALLASQADRVARIHQSISDYFQNSVSNHGSKAVSATLQRIGQKPADLWSSLGSLGYPNSMENLDNWTKIRHQIVHQGQRPTVRRPDARTFLEFISKLVDRIDQMAESALQ